MFKDFIINVISLAFFCVISDMLMPEGTMKKYLSLTFGFMMICTLAMPLTRIINAEPFEFSFDSSMSNEEINAKSDAYILKLHEENIRAYITEIYGNDTEAFVDLYSDGSIKSVAVHTPNNDPILLKELKEILGCENIEVKMRIKNDS